MQRERPMILDYICLCYPDIEPVVLESIVEVYYLYQASSEISATEVLDLLAAISHKSKIHSTRVMDICSRCNALYYAYEVPHKIRIC